ncbi:MAG: hypothetical protein SynsKO_30260 [Synoicihabitans sp.]
MSSEKFVSLREIAEHIGVSTSAVSLALRNSPKISAQRREEIQKVAVEMGYKQDPRVSELMEHLRKTRSQRSHSRIAVLIPDLSREDLEHYPPTVAMIEGVREIAHTAGFGVDVIYLPELNMNWRQARTILRARGIKGVIIAPFTSGVKSVDFDFEGFCAVTTGYSIMEPAMNRACPDYLKMMEEMIAMGTNAGYSRIGMVMTYNPGGIGYKLFTSSYLFYQSTIPARDRIPMLESPRPDPAHDPGVDRLKLAAWLDKHQPEVVIGSGPVYEKLLQIGKRIPEDIGFLSIDLAEPPTTASGADHCYGMVGEEAFKLMLSALNLNLTGLPEHPRVVLVDSHQMTGTTLREKSPA